MVDNYKYLMNKIPYILQVSEINQFVIKSIATIFDTIDKYIKILDNYWLIDKASGEFLDDLGALVEVARDNETDVNYRKRIKLMYQTLDVVPTLDNIMELIKDFTSLYPEIEEGWRQDGEAGRYDLKFIAPTDFNFALIDKIDLEKIVGGGIKINAKKCIENYTESYYSGDIYAGDVLFPFKAIRNAFCDFSFDDIPYSDDVNSGDTIYLSDDLLNFEKGAVI